MRIEDIDPKPGDEIGAICTNHVCEDFESCCRAWIMKFEKVAENDVNWSIFSPVHDKTKCNHIPLEYNSYENLQMEFIKL